MVGLIFILLFGHQDTVTATTYRLTARENGPYGNVLASGYKASYKHPGKNRIIAVSRDLLKKYPFHTEVIIKEAGKLNGKWIVEDVMNKRYTKRIDFLIDWKVKTNKLHKVIITTHGKHKSHLRISERRVNAIYNVRAKQRHKQIKKRSSRIKSSKRFIS
jgi:3D (Asp-Asp-Asp) domain-containing protein